MVRCHQSNILQLNESDRVQDCAYKKQTLTGTNYLDYSYDGLSQLQGATGKESGGTVRLHEKFGYAYDPAGNLSKRTNNALIQTFNANNLNQLTTVTRSGTLTAAGTTTEAATSVTVNGSAATLYGDRTFARAGIGLADGNNTITASAQDGLGRSDTNSITVKLPATVTFNYDLKGNLTNDARRIFTYDDENQLVSVIVTNSATDSTRSEFVYDGLFRRRIRKEFKWQGGTFVPTEEVRYVYDGRLPVQERNGYNVPLVTYTRGNDLSGSREGAGGIGGLLARTDMTQLTPAHAYYHADGNGNVTALIDTQQRIAARYIYDPYGNVLAMSGPLADANLYRFSSKEAHPSSGLVYYLYRYYDANLQRWPNRDPIGEFGGLNLYGYVFNDPVNLYDPDGRIVPFIIGAIAVGGGIYLVADWALGLYDNHLNQQLAEQENSNLDRLMDADPNDIDPDAMQRSRQNLVCLGAQSASNLSKTPGTFHNGPPDPVLPPFTVKPSHLHADAAANLTGRPGYQRVGGYFRKDGTYVAPYYRRHPGSPMPPPDNNLYPRGR